MSSVPKKPSPYSSRDGTGIDGGDSSALPLFAPSPFATLKGSRNPFSSSVQKNPSFTLKGTRNPFSLKATPKVTPSPFATSPFATTFDLTSDFDDADGDVDDESPFATFSGATNPFPAFDLIGDFNDVADEPDFNGAADEPVVEITNVSSSSAMSCCKMCCTYS